jgi:ATP-dependent RNA helicase DeaD
MAKGDQAWHAEVLSLIRNAGYFDLTANQKRIIPSILKGRDLVIEETDQFGENAAFILALLISLKRTGPGVKAAVLTAYTSDTRKVAGEFRIFSQTNGFKVGELSAEGDIRREVALLQRGTDILVGQPKRFIDHIRRGNLLLSNTGKVVVKIPTGDKASGFLEDIHFIFSKLPQKKQTLLLTRDPGTSVSVYSVLLRRFRVLKGPGVSSILRGAKHRYLEVSEQEKPDALKDIAAARDVPHLVVCCEDQKRVEQIRSALNTRGVRAQILKSRPRMETLSKGLTIIADDAPDSACFPIIRQLVNYDVPRDEAVFLRRCRRLVSGISQTFTFVSPAQYLNLKQLQEKGKVTMKKEERPTSDNVVKGMIHGLIKAIKEEEDPAELNRFRRIVKRHVPIFLRSYFSAYLLKQSLGKAVLKPEAYATLFISAGKNRHVFPRDLINLFTRTLKLSPSDIGEVKILDSYSFLDISLDHASEAIAKLSGRNFRGRRLTVNLARRKGESGSGANSRA